MGLQSFENFAFAHKKTKEILVEPLVAAYLNLKWQSLKGWWYGYRLLFFLAFGVCLTLMISFIVEMNSTCEYEAEINSEIKESELVEKIPYVNPRTTEEMNRTLPNHHKFIGQKGWVESFVFSLVSSKFFAIHKIMLYIVCRAF